MRWLPPHPSYCDNWPQSEDPHPPVIADLLGPLVAGSPPSSHSRQLVAAWLDNDGLIVAEPATKGGIGTTNGGDATTLHARHPNA
jgi:hypothetical protein